MIWGFVLVEQWLTMSGTDSDAGTARILRRIQLTFFLPLLQYPNTARAQRLYKRVVGSIGGILVRLYLDGILTHLFTVSPKHMIVSSLPKTS